jgi:hypothetical protein
MGRHIALLLGSEQRFDSVQGGASQGIIDAMNAEPGASPSELRIESDAVSVWQTSRGFGLIAIALCLALIAAGVSAVFAIVGSWRSSGDAAPGKLELRSLAPRSFASRPRARRAFARTRWQAHRLRARKDRRLLGTGPTHAGSTWWSATKRSMLSIQVPDRDSAARLSRASASTPCRQLVGHDSDRCTGFHRATLAATQQPPSADVVIVLCILTVALAFRPACG